MAKYVVSDTNIGFNNIGFRRDIQNHEAEGHNPSEDAIATMELVLLKLKKGKLHIKKK